MRPSGRGRTVRRVDPEAWVVLAVGIATIIAQFFTARRSARVAERQLEAARAAVTGERESVLVVQTTYLSTSETKLRVHSGGRFPAIDLRIDCLGDDGSAVGSGRAPIVQPGSSEDVTVSFRSVESGQSFDRSRRIAAAWSDGLGPRNETLPVLSTQ